MDWRRLSPDELERHYNPRLAVPDFEDRIAAMQRRSAAARRRLEGRYDVRYGDGPLQTLDIFPAAVPDAPVHVFVHGGYWRALDKADYSFVAEPLVGAGATVIALNYDLCPALTLEGVVAEVQGGVAWVARNARDVGADPRRIFVSGHSAGADLAALAAGHDWSAEGLAADLIKGAVLVSGIYDPEPVRHISVNADVRLTEAAAARTNACRHPARCPVVVAVGGAESEGWIDQSRDYHAAAGPEAELMVVDGADHFSMAFEMADAATPLGRAMRARMGLR